MLILTGGEPMMRRDIVGLAAHASSKGLLVVMGSNGMLLTPSTVRKLKKAGVAGVGISLDSVKLERHDRFRGVSGAWEGAVRGIRTCVELGLPVLLQMTVLPWNFDEITDMMEFANSQGVTGFTLYFLVCTGRGERLSDITPQQYDDALATLVEAQPRYPNMMVRARCAPQISRLASQRESGLIGNAGCLAGRQYCRVTPEGNVTPCPYLPPVAGSIRQRSFGDIWQSADVLQQLRTQQPSGRCGRCDHQALCGGCRARAFSLAGELFGEDPWCAYQPLDLVPTEEVPLIWSVEAEQRLQRIPPFVRGRAKVAVERYAKRKGRKEITSAEMTATLEGMGRRVPFKRPGTAGATGPPQGSGERS
jgi:radical SAM protein with 4Fe4S-binding SPASM domain